LQNGTTGPGPLGKGKIVRLAKLFAAPSVPCFDLSLGLEIGKLSKQRFQGRSRLICSGVAIPSEVRREVWRRDGGKDTVPINGGHENRSWVKALTRKRNLGDEVGNSVGRNCAATLGKRFIYASRIGLPPNSGSACRRLGAQARVGSPGNPHRLGCLLSGSYLKQVASERLIAQIDSNRLESKPS
jgi:hypothetical protein